MTVYLNDIYYQFFIVIVIIIYWNVIPGSY